MTALKNPRIGIVGATGLVGRTMVKVLEETSFPCASLRLFASARSAGQTVPFRGSDLTVEEFSVEHFSNIDIALFSAGGELSKRVAREIADQGCVVIDNSSAWRMDADVPLVVPEVNAETLKQHKGIIANPNCSTIQLVVFLKPLHELFGLEEIVVSTYQSISGAGQQGIQQLMNEISSPEAATESPYPHPIAFNTMFHPFEGEQLTVEERKMVRETRRIMNLPSLSATVTCVRIPVTGGHGESVHARFSSNIDINQVHSELNSAPGIEIVDDVQQDKYPTVLSIAGKNHVEVGRLRVDENNPRALNAWITADNVRKGAATNAVQIAQALLEIE